MKLWNALKGKKDQPMQLCAAQKHYYDRAVYPNCPYCEDGGSPPLTPPTAAPAAPKTEIVRPSATTPAAPKTEMVRPAAPKTTIIGAADRASGSLPVVGWLVVLNGAGKGRDFRLVQGENRIGRDADMEVCLDFGADSDDTVSRERHASVVFDHHAGEFFVERGHSRNLPLLNGATVRGEPVLKARDILQVGRTKLLFIPLCGSSFAWTQ